METTSVSVGRRPTSLTILKGREILRRIKNKVQIPLPLFRMLNRNKERFECPICGYEGPFADFGSFAGYRKHAICPRCGGLERRRLQYLVVRDVFRDLNGREVRMLHFAPEKFFRQMFSLRVAKYGRFVHGRCRLQGGYSGVAL